MLCQILKYYNDGNVFLKLKTKMFFNVKSKKLILKIEKNFILNFLQKILWTPPPGSAPARFYTKIMKMFYAPLFGKILATGLKTLIIYFIYCSWMLTSFKNSVIFVEAKLYVLFRTANNNIEGWTVMICIVFFFYFKILFLLLYPS